MTRRSGPHRRRDARRKLGPPAPGLFHDIVLAPDRERIPDANPMVSLGEADDPAFRREVERRALDTYLLERRDVTHAELVELSPEGLVGPRERRRRREARESERWCAGAPVFLPRAAERMELDILGAGVDALHRRLRESGGLGRFVESATPGLGSFRMSPVELPLADPERDIERRGVEQEGGPDDLWVKTGRLSTIESDTSVRLRVSFGHEGDDDASQDETRHRAVSDLAQRLLPGARALANERELWERVARHVGGDVYATQHIAYWNAANGGARFHHDAFAEDGDAPRQVGVAYAQLTGRTVWLALSIEDLFLRMRELAAWAEAEELPGIGPRILENRTLLERRATALGELALPGCGRFGPIVDAPEVTSFLADAGHALVLRPGDLLLLPNHGVARTAMHSVFSGSSEPGYALSVAIRSASPVAAAPDVGGSDGGGSDSGESDRAALDA